MAVQLFQIHFNRIFDAGAQGFVDLFFYFVIQIIYSFVVDESFSHAAISSLLIRVVKNVSTMFF